MTTAEHAILVALAVGDRGDARQLLGQRIRDREARTLPTEAHTLPTDTNTERH